MAPPSTPNDLKSKFSSDIDSIRATVANIRRVEGDRGIATRWTVVFRYVVYMLGIILTAAIVGAYPALGPLAARLLILSCVMIIVTAAIAAVLYPVERRNLIEQMKFFVFGVVCFPAIVLGALLSVVSRATLGGSGSAVATPSDALIVSLAQNAMPYLFWATVLVPPFIFVKTVVGLRKLHRDRTDDEEMMRIVSRQDHLYR